jgi:hypothetical protein
MSRPRTARLAGVLLAASLCGGAAANDALPGVRFEVCHQQGCARQTPIELSPEDARLLQHTFGPSAEDARGERHAIARTIAAFERLVGPRTGTDVDMGGTFPGAFRAGQMDCIDEATNTTRYLQLLERAGLLRWHRVAEPATRVALPRRWWPHTTAVIHELATGERYAVDAWFDANGQPPHIVELGIWRRGWTPASGAAGE